MINRIKKQYVRATGQPVMANTDWCNNWEKTHSGNCEENGCPHAEHCKNLCQVFIDLLKERL